MPSIFAQIIQISSRIQSILLAIMFACIGHSMLLVLLPIRMQSVGISASIIGATMACYSIGFLMGSAWGIKIIERAGHNRSYAASASVMIIAVNMHTFTDSVYIVFLLRVLVGIAMSIIYLTLESWLNATSERQSRGTIFSLYQFFIALGFVLAPFVSFIFDINDLRSYTLISCTIALSMIPLVLTRFPSPQVPEAQDRLPIIEMLRDTPSGAVMIFFSGIFIASLSNLLSLFAVSLEYTNQQIALLVAVATGSSLVFQIPIGKLTDIFDERPILFWICICSVITSFVIISSVLAQLNWLIISLATAVLGGLISCIYPVSVKFIFNQIDSDKAVSAMSSLLILSSMGLMLGPVIGSIFMDIFGPIGLFYCIGFIMIIASFFMAFRVIVSKKPTEDTEKIPYVISYDMLHPLNTNLDPRSDFYVTKIRNRTVHSLASSIGISPAKSQKLIMEHMQYLKGFTPEEILEALVMLKPRLAKPIIRAMLAIYPEKPIEFTNSLKDLISMRKQMINNLLLQGLTYKANQETKKNIQELFVEYVASVEDSEKSEAMNS